MEKQGSNPPAYPTQQGFPQQPGYQPVSTGYAEKGYPSSQNTVIVTQPGQAPIPQEGSPPAAGTLCLACLVAICCCPLLGCLAFCCGVMATCSSDYESASSKLSVSKKLSYAGIIVGVILTVLYLVLQYTGLYDVNSQLNSDDDAYDYYSY